MKLTLSWLKRHLETDAGLDEIVRTLTMIGLEVDAVVDRAADLKPFIVARVVSAERHPNADKLQVCVVDTGSAQVQVVCGAPNARGGMIGVFAPGGAVIPRTGAVLKPSKIRGVESNGMLCSGYELALSDDHDGIVELPADAPVGVPYATFAKLDDAMLDVKITANRADCLGVRGLARDLAAAGLGQLKPLAASIGEWDFGVSPATLSDDAARVLQNFAETRTHIHEIEAKVLQRRGRTSRRHRRDWVEVVPGSFASPIGIAIEDRAACPLFLGRWIRGVRNGPSPAWLIERLTSIGLRPISALVDITNYLTFDVDRPLHVFDAAKIQGSLRIRPAQDGETLAALNGKDYALDAGMTVIADDSGVLSLGGVIGGESTGCSEATTDVFIEAALFDPVRTAATGRRLNLQSDARYRFERGLDPAFVFDGIEIATRLVLELCGGEPSEVVVAGAEPDWQRIVTLRPERVASLGGVTVPQAEIVRILATLGCTVEPQDGALSVVPPSWRADLEGEADLVEEVLRLNGYDHIPAVPLPRPAGLPKPALDPGQRRAGLVRRSLAERGLDEAVTYSFMASALVAGNEGVFGPLNQALRVVNPISAELDLMRPSILPNLLQAARRSADRGLADAALFELGPQYGSDAPDGQRLVAAGIRVGAASRKTWNRAARPVDPFDVKADVMAALAAADVPVDNLQVTADPPGWYHPGRGGAIRLGPKTVLAHFGEIHPRFMAALDLKGPAMGFEIYLDAVPFAKSTRRAALRLSPFQPVERDYAFLVDRGVAASQVLRAARGVDKALVAEIRLFDVYTGQGVPEGKKSLALTVRLQPTEATLTEAQIEAFSAALVAQVGKATGGVLRG